MNHVLSFKVLLPLFLYGFFIAFLSVAKSGIQVQVLTLGNALSVIVGAVTLIFSVLLIDCFIRHISIKKVVLFLFFSFYIFLSIYHYRMQSFFDIKLFFENFEIIFHKESLDLINSQIKGKDFFIFFLFTGVIFFYGVIKNKFISTPPLRPKKGVAFLFVYICLILSPYNMYDQSSVVLADTYKYFFKPINLNPYAHKILKKEFPFIQEFNEEKIVKGKEKKHPHIFIIAIESFNSNFVEKKTPEGQYYTPFFNSLINKGFYVENFFGNSIQTAKGIFAILCSTVPVTKGKVFQKYSNSNFRCLAEILKERGYTTLFYQGHGDLHFDNSLAFYKNNNFDKVETISSNLLSEKEKKENIWGWGPQDNLLYRDVFRKIDEIHAQSKGEKKFFTTISTISSHMMFDQLPKKQRVFYPENKTKKQKYSNVIRAVDKYLETFFSELNKRDHLKDSIVIITGDHSFPVGEHNIYHNERGFYNEFFKVPFLVLWKNKVKPERVKNLSYSQVDIAPTILDLLDIGTKNHFQGSSIFKKEKTLQYLVQPYSGKFLSIIDYPFKYVFHEKSRKEFLFNLNEDVRELKNLISHSQKKKISEKLKKFRERLGYFYANDIVIENNRLWKD